MDKNLIYTQGKGKYGEFTVNSISGYKAFNNDEYKRAYIDSLEDADKENTCLIAYCVLADSAHFIVKGNNKKALKCFAEEANELFFAKTQALGLNIGYPLRKDYSVKYFKNTALRNEINAIHRLPGCFTDYTSYSFSSYSDLMNGYVEAVNVIKAENPQLTKADFEKWFDGDFKIKAPIVTQRESYGEVITSAKERYLKDGGGIPEEEVVFVMSEICDRAGIGYNTCRRRMGISKKRRDVLIAVLCDLISRREHSFYQAVACMKLKKENNYDLLTEVIVEINRKYHYAYDHTIYSLGVNDPHYFILTDIISGLHTQFGYGFVEICKMFHIQNEIIEIRNRVGF